MRCYLVIACAVMVLGTAAACGADDSSATVTIYPNLECAREDGFSAIAGHPPFTVDFSATTSGGDGALSYSWDFDGDDCTDSTAIDPEPFVFGQPGVYVASLRVTDELGREAVAKQRIAVIGPPKLPLWKYGVQAHLNRSYGLYQSDAEVERAAEMIRDVGIDVVRLDLAWAAIQPRQDEYQWDDYDYLVSLADRHGFDLLPIIGFSAEWASTAEGAHDWQDWFFAAPSPIDYAWFAYSAASRYAGRIRAWEIWSEPNTGLYWRPEPDPAAYVELLRNAYLAIKYADPSAVVVLGGLANDESLHQPQYVWYPPEEFLLAVYENDGEPYFDVVGRHPYTHPNEGTLALNERLDRLYSVMEAHGDTNTPIWLTELGYSAIREAGVTDVVQGRWLTECLDAAFSLSYVQVAFWYNFRNKGIDATAWDCNYGLVSFDWEPKPAFEAYRAHIAGDE